MVAFNIAKILGYLLSKNGRLSMRFSNLANRSSRSKSSTEYYHGNNTRK